MTCYAPQPEADGALVCDLDTDHLGDHTAHDGLGGKVLATWPGAVDIDDVEGGKVTFSGEAWEWLYGYLHDLTKRGLAVVINGDITVALHELDKPFNEQGYQEGFVAGVLWDDETKDWDGGSVTIPLFEDGMPTVIWVHVL